MLRKKFSTGIMISNHTDIVRERTLMYRQRTVYSCRSYYFQCKIYGIVFYIRDRQPPTLHMASILHFLLYKIQEKQHVPGFNPHFSQEIYCDAKSTHACRVALPQTPRRTYSTPASASVVRLASMGIFDISLRSLVRNAG